MKRTLKRWLHRSPSGTLMFNRLRVWREKAALRLFDDHQYVTHTYRERFGREIDLANPVAFTEKLQWLKLFYRDPRMPVCSDKYAVRGFVLDAGYGHLLNPLIGVYARADDIDFDALPNRFALKATHGSGWNLVCKDKDLVNWRVWRRVADSWLRLDLSVFGREWHYREIEPRLIVEEFIDIDPLIDYKLMCFNGEPRFVQVNHDLNGCHYVDFFSMDWEKHDMTYRHYVQSECGVPKPGRLGEMIVIARDLCRGFPFVRVDFYATDGQLLIGELTFFPGGGLQPIIPAGTGYDEMLGDWLVLPPANHNLDLLDSIGTRA